MSYNSKTYSRALQQIRVYLSDNHFDNPTIKSIQRFADAVYKIQLSNKEAVRWLMDKAKNGDFNGWPIKSKAVKDNIRKQKKKLKEKIKIARQNGVRLNSDGWLDYQKYLDSKYWRAVRVTAIIRDNYKCTICGTSDNLQVHHITYLNIGNEINHMNDLITVCEKCHNDIHRHRKRGKDYRKATY